MLSFAPLKLNRALILILPLILFGAARSRAAEPPAPTPAGVVSDTDARVAVASALGERLFKLGRYEEAVAEYRRAYELRADPRFLYHIGECYRELGATDQALFYYERFLAGAPAAPERDEVLDKMTELEGSSARHPRAPQPGLALGPDETAPRPPAPARAWRRWWFWTAVGVAVASGVTAAVLAGRSATPLPSSDLGDKRFY